MIDLLNVKPGEIFTQSIVYLFGYCCNFTAAKIEVIDEFGLSIIWSITNSYFKVKNYSIINNYNSLSLKKFYLSIQKAFVQLKYGKNEINIKTDNSKIRIVLFRLKNYGENEENSSNNHVRVLYVICKGK